ncbi:hypothetical protein HL736_001217 [Campylobacter lari]|uniref:hypothetical protein n=1 Tax=Campylobacter volucris TaxID=1031542 RepID=UPI0018A0236B|nr:hypothetical protein [Campylobacter volucris]EFO9318208.1 hypothetical protein [Campylobacter lari]MBF7048146.1 hypothetical protein [Campylobacter volucris]HED1004897.1 hypothetical protein [Campylobacter jejuni]
MEKEKSLFDDDEIAPSKKRAVFDEEIDKKMIKEQNKHTNNQNNNNNKNPSK